MDGLPIIRLELENMKHSIVSHLSGYNNDIEKMVSEEIDKALENFDLRKVVRETILKSVKDSVEHIFSYGRGKQWVTEAVSKSLFPED